MKKLALGVMLCGCVVVLALGWQSFSQVHGNYSISIKAGDYTVQGPPTVTAAFIDQVLAQAGSPAAGSGAALYSLGVTYGIDPIYALAFFHHESTYGTTGEATITRSLGNERCIPDRPCIDQKAGGYALMRSWLDGYDRWYSLIVNLYIKQWHLTTVEQIIPKYAPSSDGNNEQAYISAVEQDVVTWRAESQVGQ
jgi:hypothetical protein